MTHLSGAIVWTIVLPMPIRGKETFESVYLSTIEHWVTTYSGWVLAFGLFGRELKLLFGVVE